MEEKIEINYLGQTETVNVFGEIEEPYIHETIAEIIKLAAKRRPFEIYVSSSGGDSRGALALAEVIDRLNVSVTVVLWGDVSSAALLIAVSGYNNPLVRTVALPSTRALYHSGSMEWSEYPTHIAEDMIESNKEVREYEDNYITSHSKITQEQLNELYRSERYFTAEDMLELGIIDEII